MGRNLLSQRGRNLLEELPKERTPIYRQLPVKEHPVLGTAQDVAGQFGTAYFNQLAAGLPKAALRKAGYELPDPVTGLGKAAEVVGGTAGIVSGIPTRAYLAGARGAAAIAPRMARAMPRLGGALSKTLLRPSVVGGALAGAAMTPQTEEGKILAPKERAWQAAGGAALAGGGALIGKTAATLGRETARNIGRLSKTALDTVKRVGYGKVKEAMREGGKYISERIIPKARQRVIDAVTKSVVKSKDMLEDLGFTPDDIRDLERVSPVRLEELKGLVASSWHKFNSNLESARRKTGAQIARVYKNAEKRGIRPSIKKTMAHLAHKLREKGYVDLKGDLVQEAETIDSKTIKSLVKTYGRYKEYANTRVSIPQYRNLITSLESALSTTDDKFNTLATSTIRKAREEAARYIPGIKYLNKKYSDNSILSTLSKKLDTAFNTKPEQLESTYNRIRNTLNQATREKYTRIYGKDLIDDIDALSAAREFDPEMTEGLFRGLGRWGTRGALRAEEEVVKPTIRFGRGLIDKMKIQR